MNEIAINWQSGIGLLAFAVFTAVLSYFSCLKATNLAIHSGMIAHPGARQSHAVATPTGGGLGLVFSIVVMAAILHFIFPLPAFWWQKMLPGVLLLVLIGWRDDKLPVSSFARLLVQLAVSFWLLGFDWFSLSIEGAVFYVSTILAMVWMMNLYNFMDGSNGMAGFQGVFAGVMVAGLFLIADQYAMALISVAVAAACVGFLPLNFPVATVFMGDVASVPLGFIFAALAVFGLHSGALSWVATILVMSVFIVDATLTLLARVFRGERWYTAHAQHIYQRLIAHGWSHSRVLVVYQSINVMLVMPAVVLAEIYPHYAKVLTGLVFAILGAGWHVANRRLGMFAKEQVT